MQHNSDNQSGSIVSQSKTSSSTIKAPKISAIIIIAIVLLIVSWVIYGYSSSISAVLGYTGHFCGDPYFYNIITGITVVLSVVNILLSRLLVTGSSRWKVFILFEAIVLLDTFFTVYVQNSLCDPSGWHFF